LKKGTILALFCLVSVFVAYSEDKSLDAARWYNWANYYFNLKKYDKAANYAEKALTIDPYQEGAFIILQKIKAIDKDFNTKWDKMHLPNLSTTNKEARDWYFNGLNRYVAGDYIRAYYCFKKAFGIVKDDPAIRAMFYRSRFRISMKKLSESDEDNLESIWKDIVKRGKKDPESSYYWFMMGRYYYERQNDKTKGLECFKIALAFDENNKELITYLKNIELEKKKEMEEKAQLEQEKLRKMEKARKEREGSKEVVLSLETSEIKVTSKQEIEKKKENAIKKKDFEEFKKTIGIQRMSAEVVAKKTKNVNKKNKCVNNREKELKKIKEIIFEAQKMISEGKYGIVRTKLKEALLKLLKYYPDDLAANYYLALLYQREKNSIKATEYSVKCMYIIENFAYEDKALEKEARITMNCFLRATIIQASLQAYNNREKVPMKAYNFSMLELSKKGYFINKERKLKLELKLPDTEKKINFEWKLDKWDYIKWKDEYFINSQGLVECKKHGLSPFLLGNTQVEEY